MSELLNDAIASVNKAKVAYCHYIVANEVGSTGSHQCGFFLNKHAWPLIFDSPGVKGTNKHKFIRINWPNGLKTDSKAHYYGGGTRNEYRITRFGKDFPYLLPDRAGDLFVLAQMEDGEYNGFVLTSEDIDDFIAYFDLSPASIGGIINVRQTPEETLALGIKEIIENTSEFPITEEMSRLARELFFRAYHSSEAKARREPDKALLGWVNAEYSLFRAFEDKEFFTQNPNNFKNCQELIEYANSLTNRRKARAGKSLEHHLSSIFTISSLIFEEQVRTEGNKRPDFIFPNGLSYHNWTFPTDGLTFLGAKTTCKDRWRQVLNEADRIPNKYLFTLQQGVSANQLQEMKDENLSLVVPQDYIKTFDERYRKDIWPLSKFILMVKEKQSHYQNLYSKFYE